MDTGDDIWFVLFFFEDEHGVANALEDPLLLPPFEYFKGVIPPWALPLCPFWEEGVFFKVWGEPVFLAPCPPLLGVALPDFLGWEADAGLALLLLWGVLIVFWQGDIWAVTMIAESVAFWQNCVCRKDPRIRNQLWSSVCGSRLTNAASSLLNQGWWWGGSTFLVLLHHLMSQIWTHNNNAKQ